MFRCTLCCTAVFLLAATAAPAQHVSDPKASYIDVAERHAALSHTTDPRTAQAIASLAFCTKLPFVPPPSGRMDIPHHYISGSHGPVNPAEAVATRVYYAYEDRITAGMNQWLVTADPHEAQCAQQQIDAWAQAAALLDYDPKESSQAWFPGRVDPLRHRHQSVSPRQRRPSLDPPAMVQRDIRWMNKVAHRTVEFDKAGKQTNNHHYWRGLAAVATGVISSDDDLFNWGIGVYMSGINELDQRGALPQEMARHERSIHYQSFALQPLAPLASFAERQHVPLYEYRSATGRSIHDAVNFLGAALASPEIMKAYTPDEQMLPDSKESDFFSFAEFYSHHAGPAGNAFPSIS